jgi:hypothetical protein
MRGTADRSKNSWLYSFPIEGPFGSHHTVLNGTAETDSSSAHFFVTHLVCEPRRRCAKGGMDRSPYDYSEAVQR